MTNTAIVLQSSEKQKLHVNSCDTPSCIRTVKQPVTHGVRTEKKSFTTSRKPTKQLINVYYIPTYAQVSSGVKS